MPRALRGTAIARVVALWWWMASVLCSVGIGASLTVQEVSAPPHSGSPTKLPLPFCVTQVPRTFPGEVEGYDGEFSKGLDGAPAYLTKHIIKDRVPGGWNTFVAHQYTARDILHHFSVLAPERGCGTLATPGETAHAYEGGCDVATNGGFFVPHDAGEGARQCIGPLVTDGRWRSHQYRQNVVFGVEQPHEGDENVTVVVGYLTEAEVARRRWVQLVSGVVWLVKDGQSFVAESMQYENFTAERSGPGPKFRDLKAPRLALGITATGDLLLVAVDGSEPDWEGLPLTDVAQVMIGLGALHAINLDGGGSVSVYEEGEIVNIPSDVCPNTTFPKYRCPRAVSSALCLHGFRNVMATHTRTRGALTQSLRPSHTTFTVSFSGGDEAMRGTAGYHSIWANLSAEGILIAFAKIIVPLAVCLGVLWRLLCYCRDAHRGSKPVLGMRRASAGRLVSRAAEERAALRTVSGGDTDDTLSEAGSEEARDDGNDLQPLPGADPRSQTHTACVAATGEVEMQRHTHP